MRKALVATLLFACSSPSSSSGTAHFATATDAQLLRAFQSASGTDFGSAWLLARETLGDGNPCPAETTSGTTTTFTGGCTDGNGGMWSGSMTLDNVPAFPTIQPGFDQTRPGTVTYSSLRLLYPGILDEQFDGTATADYAAHEDTADFDLRLFGAKTTDSLDVTCDTSSCSTSADSMFDIDGFGSAYVEGTWGTASGSITLHGADDLTFDMAHLDSSTGCVPYSGAKSGTLCPPQGPAS